MFWPIAGVLVLFWTLGLLSGHMIGGFVHLLLVVAVLMGLVRFWRERRPAHKPVGWSRKRLGDTPAAGATHWNHPGTFAVAARTVGGQARRPATPPANQK